MLSLYVKRFEEKFADDAVCVEFAENLRWPNGFHCSACGHRDAYRIETRRLPLWECRNCKLQTSLTSNTMMHRSRTNLKKWLMAMFLVSCNKNGINAVQLARILEVTYKTAWKILHQIRCAISDADQHILLSGKVEAKLELFMKQLIPTEENLQKERTVVVAKGMNQEENPYYKIKRIDRDKQAREYLSLCEKAEFRSRYCDSTMTELQLNSCYQQYKKLRDPFEKRSFDASADFVDMINDARSKCFLPLSIVAMEAFRWINDTYHGIGSKYAQQYMDEYCFRLNYSNDCSLVPLEKLFICMLEFKYPKVKINLLTESVTNSFELLSA